MNRREQLVGHPFKGGEINSDTLITIRKCSRRRGKDVYRFKLKLAEYILCSLIKKLSFLSLEEEQLLSDCGINKFLIFFWPKNCDLYFLPKSERRKYINPYRRKCSKLTNGWTFSTSESAAKARTIAREEFNHSQEYSGCNSVERRRLYAVFLLEKILFIDFLKLDKIKQYMLINFFYKFWQLFYNKNIRLNSNTIDYCKYAYTE